MLFGVEYTYRQVANYASIAPQGFSPLPTKPHTLLAMSNDENYELPPPYDEAAPLGGLIGQEVGGLGPDQNELQSPEPLPSVSSSRILMQTYGQIILF